MEICGGEMQETVRTYDAKVVCKLYRGEGFADEALLAETT